MTPLYDITGLAFSYGGRQVLDVENLVIGQGRVTAVVGPNGAGKSTLFDLLAFLRKPDRGRIRFAGAETSGASDARLRRRVGYVQQRPYLMKMSVRDNIGLGLAFRKTPRAARDAAVDKVAAELGLGPLLQRDAAGLSGGEAQKVALARALALQPEVIILDEPFTYLDEITIREIEEWIAAQRAARSKTVIFSAHDRLRAQSLSDSILSLIEGRLYPSSSGNLFVGAVDRDSGTFISGAARFVLPESITSGRTLFIDPKHLVVSREKLSSSMRNNFPGAIVSMSSVNGEICLRIQSDVLFSAVITRQSLEELGLQPGDAVWVSCKSSQLSVI